MDDSLFIKPLISVCAGYGFGIALGAFMNVHATDLVDYDLHRGVRARSRSTNIEYLKKIKGTARGFATFAFFFTSYLTISERLRNREDRLNDFLAGALTAGNLMLDLPFGWSGLIKSSMIGGGFCYLMDVLMGDMF